MRPECDPNATWMRPELDPNFTTRLRNVVIRVHHLRWMSQRVVFWREERALCRIAICQLSNNFILAFKEETKSRQGRTMTSLQGEGGKVTWILELDFWLKRVWSEKKLHSYLYVLLFNFRNNSKDWVIFFGTRIFYATTKIFYKSRFQFLGKLVGVLLSHKCICSIHLREWEEGRKKESEMRVERERDDHKWTSKGGLELKPLWLLQTSFILLHRQVQYKAEGRGIERASMSKKRFYELTLFFASFLAILVAPQK